MSRCLFVSSPRFFLKFWSLPCFLFLLLLSSSSFNPFHLFPSPSILCDLHPPPFPTYLQLPQLPQIPYLLTSVWTLLLSPLFTPHPSLFLTFRSSPLLSSSTRDCPTDRRWEHSHQNSTKSFPDPQLKVAYHKRTNIIGNNTSTPKRTLQVSPSPPLPPTLSTPLLPTIPTTFTPIPTRIRMNPISRAS